MEEPKPDTIRPTGVWIKITEESIANLVNHYFYLVADTRFGTPMKAKYHEEYPQFEILGGDFDTTNCICLLEDNCTITHYMKLPEMPKAEGEE